MKKVNELDCRNLKFDPKLALRRMEKAKLVIKPNVIKSILCFCLYILGAKRNEIADFLGLPHNTVRSMLKGIMRDGFTAFFDRRRKKNDGTISPKPTEKKQEVKITTNDKNHIISINNAEISICRENKLQFKSLVLTLTANKLMSKTASSSLLNATSSHVGYLCKKLREKDIGCLIDQRRGQRQDYVYKPELKSELILQYVVNASNGEKTSGHAIASGILERTRIDLSERSVRHHISKLGLRMIAGKITDLVCSQKKT